MRSRYLRTSKLLCGVAICAMAINTMAPLVAVAGQSGGSQGWGTNDGKTTTPIKHVIVIIGENRTFDHVFATYQSPSGDKVWNLLSEGIVNSDGTPGPNYRRLALQNSAEDIYPAKYSIHPDSKAPYTTLPTPLAGGPTTPYFSSVAEAMLAENGLATTPINYYVYLTTGGTGLPAGAPDTRIMYDGDNVFNLPPGPFQLTPGVPYDAYAASPVHRFYQMWQELDCKGDTGCREDLFPWVEATVGAGSNGQPPTSTNYVEGATAMGFYNVQPPQNDAPYLTLLANNYSMSDNYHQAVEGGTGANHIMLGTGDAIWFSDGNGNPEVPPNGFLSAGPNSGTVAEIENPNPAYYPADLADPTPNNWYTEDGYGGGSYGSPSYGGGSYTECADTSQPGVASVVSYLRSLPRVNPNCQPSHYYLLNNYNPGYFGDGTNAYTPSQLSNPNNTVFTIPPSSVPNIGDDLLAHNISFAYFGDQFDRYLADPYYLNPLNAYCNICNFFQYSTSIMTNATVRQKALKDTTDLYNDIGNDTLPAVSFVKPSGFVDGHPASSKIDLLEGFVKKIVDMVQANPALWPNTAIMITMDEGGGYYDSGYVQALDYFGDGTRIPMIVVSKYSTGGHISHTYTDHVSVLKFIEANWKVRPVTNRSRDNLPNPITTGKNPYVPVNTPAIGNLMDLFQFPSSGNGNIGNGNSGNGNIGNGNSGNGNIGNGNTGNGNIGNGLSGNGNIGNG